MYPSSLGSIESKSINLDRWPFGVVIEYVGRGVFKSCADRDRLVGVDGVFSKHFAIASSESQSVLGCGVVA